MPRSSSTVPDAGCGDLTRVVCEVLGLAAQGALDSIRQVGVAPVEDLAEQVGQEREELGRHVRFGQDGFELLQGDRDEADLASGRLRDLAYRLLEGQEPGAGELVDLARVPALRQGGHRDVCYVA